MPDPALRLLDGVAWRGVPVPGDRPAALLAALALEPAGVADASLVARVWVEEEPAHSLKALQVLVSRLRSRSDATTVTRYDGGYRLGLGVPDVDAWLLSHRLSQARTALVAGDPVDALALLDDVLDWRVDDSTGDGPLAELRARARRDLEGVDQVRGLALSRVGRHVEALPLLTTTHRRHPDDAETLMALLRAEAATSGAAVALGRYEAYRENLAERLGVDPDPALQRLHRELLAADDPVRTGLRFDGDGLLGREQDLVRLRGALASGRLVTILGPGGIGKTSIAQVLARESTMPRVHVVEMVGVGTGDDVVAAVGAALGVRGSVTARHTLTAAQLADVRGRIAQELDAGPALLVLDNCEHVLEPVAALVAFLLATTRHLHVLATSRAPLRLAAERSVPLSQLSVSDAEQLFVRRASATRPDANLDPDAVRAVVERLDGLPLAVELAAARVRSMTVHELGTALEDRFATLRTRDRAAPDRHRTLGAVIAWSWDLLTDDERRALAWMSVFQDGFDRATAAVVLGPEGPDLVDALVEQSLLVLSEDGGTARFRALETIREFAAMRLVASGEHDEALVAQHRWATELADASSDLMVAEDQVQVVDRLVREHNNLTDVLRHGLAVADRELVARMVALLGSLWTVTGDQPRVFAIADSAAEVLEGWDVPPRLHRAAHEAAAVLMIHLSWMPGVDLGGLQALLTQGSLPTGTWGLIAHSTYVAHDPPAAPDRLARLAGQQSRPAQAAALLMWASIVAENEGDVPAATRHAESALALGALPPYLLASLHAELSQLSMVTGDHHTAARHAEIAWPLLVRLHSETDAYSLQVATALAPLMDGDPDTAQAILDRFGLPDGETVQLSARMVWHMAHAEVALARGDVEEALRRYDAGVEAMDVPGTGATPWLMLAAAAALVARARHGGAGSEQRARELRDLVLDSTTATPEGALWFTDLPLNGVLLVGLAAWGLRFGPSDEHDDACRFLAIAQRWAYNRSIPVMAWDAMRAMADAARPGRVDALLAEYADRPGPALLPVAAATLGRLRRA